MSRWVTIARVRLPLTIDEHVAIIDALKPRHGEDLFWTHRPRSRPRWLVIAKRRSS